MFRESRPFISRSAMWFGTNLCGLSSMPISSIVRLRLFHESNLDRQSLPNRMLDFLKRRRLIRRGLASRKTRRRRAHNELLQSLEYAPYIKVFIFVGFIAGLAFLIFSGQQPEPTKTFVIALLFLAIAMAQLWINQPRTFSQNSRVLLVFGIILVQLAVTKLLLVLCNGGTVRFLKPEMGGLIAPYAFAPLVLSVLLGRNHGIYAAVSVSLWSSVLFGKIDAPLLVTSLISGFTAVYLTLQVRRRSKLIRAGVGVGCAIWLLSLTFVLIGPINLFSPIANDWGMIGLQSALAVGNGIVTALIIIAHVKEGVDLALKHKLNQRIIDIIQEHHGTSLVYYFYQRALQQQEDARAGGKIMNIREEDIPEVGEESFRYSGPKPQTKESAIVSLADIVESASRSLEKPTLQKIEQLVDELVEERIADRQLDECDLTLGELKIIAERFRFTLMTMLHSRIAYPKQETRTLGPREESLHPDVMAMTRKPATAPPVSAA